jgi:DNA repair protein RadC
MDSFDISRFSTHMVPAKFQTDKETELSIFGRSALEKLLIIHMNVSHHIIDVQIEGAISIKEVNFPLRRIVADAIALDTHSLLIAHNHPSGIAKPSKSDMRHTRQLEKVLQPLNIQLADHLIVAGGERFSFRAAGLL